MIISAMTLLQEVFQAAQEVVQLHITFYEQPCDAQRTKCYACTFCYKTFEFEAVQRWQKSTLVLTMLGLAISSSSQLELNTKLKMFSELFKTCKDLNFPKLFNNKKYK